MTYLDVLVPGPWWNALTYTINSDVIPPCGSRVRVPVKSSLRVGFVSGIVNAGERLEKSIEFKEINEILDNDSVFGENLWNLALWIGHYFMCGAGEVFKVISPSQLLKGNPILQDKGAFIKKENKQRKFSESECYLPYDSQREDFYINRLAELGEDDTALVLFPERSVAKHFYEILPPKLKDCAVLWENKGTKNFWRKWTDVRNGAIKYVVGGPSAVYSPFPNISLVIVEDEANPAYISMRYPSLPVRSIAGQLAFISGSEFVLGGRLPSAKTYFRKKIKCSFMPKKELIHFVDIKDGFNALIQGVEKTLAISKTLVSETAKCLNENLTALWIFDRKGYAVEVLCENCGHGLLCPVCGGVMTAEGDALEKEIAVFCRRCLNRKKLPESCSVCHGSYFVGKKPGLEALKSMSAALCERELNRKVVENKLVVGTRKELSLCDRKNVGLVAWIDIDLEAYKTDYTSRFNAFSMVWESLWRGIKRPETPNKTNKYANRRVIIQSRNPARGWQIGLKSGWDYFWGKELAERAELEFPPFKPLIEIEVSIKESGKLAKLIEESGYVVMSSAIPHDGKHYIWLSTSSLSDLENVLSSRFSINKSRYGYPRVRILVE